MSVDEVRPRRRHAAVWAGFPTSETSQKRFDETDFQRVVQAYPWAYPAVTFESIRLTLKQDLRIDFNDLGIADNLVGRESV